MKKSELLHYAMDAFLDSDYNNELKLKVLKVLLEEEDIALFAEMQNAAVTDE